MRKINPKSCTSKTKRCTTVKVEWSEVRVSVSCSHLGTQSDIKQPSSHAQPATTEGKTFWQVPANQLDASSWKGHSTFPFDSLVSHTQRKVRKSSPTVCLKAKPEIFGKQHLLCCRQERVAFPATELSCNLPRWTASMLLSHGHHHALAYLCFSPL